jgi:uncharacterized protein (TIGR02246 family)
MMPARPGRILSVLVVLVFLAAGCQSPAPAPAGLADTEKTALRDTAQRWTQAVLAGDMAAVAAFYLEDAVLLPPHHGEVAGRAAIESFFREFPPFTAFALEHVDVNGAADLAYVRGRFTLTMQIPEAGPLEDRGKYLEIWKKQADGSWMIKYDMFSSDIPLPGAP